MPLVVSLSTIPPRFDRLAPVLDCLLGQSAKIDEIRLYVPRHYRRFPDYDGSEPDVPKGVRIIRPDDDLGPASKVLFAARELRGTDTDIIYCDDDRLYAPHWFTKMLDQRGDRHDHCFATAILNLSDMGFDAVVPGTPLAQWIDKFPQKQMLLIKRKLKQMLTGTTDPKPGYLRNQGYAAVAEGFGAVLVKPDFFDDAVFDIPPVLWSVDDVWLSGHMAKNGVPIWCGHNFGTPPSADATDIAALADAVIDGSGRHEANRACVRYFQDTYGIWR